MANYPRNCTCDNISQRAGYAYLVSLTPAVLIPGASPLLEGAISEFHAFLGELYTAFIQSPDAFGLPVTEDLCIKGGEVDPVQFKQLVKRKLDRPSLMIERGLDFLMWSGRDGTLDEGVLLLEKGAYAGLLKTCRVKRVFLAGIGLVISEEGDWVRFSSHRFPGMVSALKALGEACCSYGDARLGKFHFARCDFRALDGHFSPGAEDLYAIFAPVDFERLVRLHQFFTHLDYKPRCQVSSVMGWEVQYQGPSKIKSTPLLRVHYDPRYQIPLRLDIKCASTNRIVDLVYQQP